ncbi:MAG: energy transducer TonB [Myxococcales bacterium]|nr:energy transducer TonB [Myxococcales bacterium]
MGRALGAAAIMLLGVTGVLLGMAWMNGYTARPAKAAAVEATAIELAPPPPPPKTQKPRPPRQRPKPTNNARPRTPPPQLGSALSAVSLGASTRVQGDLSRAADRLVGDAAGADLTMTASAVDEPPQATSRVAPAYPPAARRQGIQGNVVFRLTIGADGVVQQARIVAAEPPGVFDDAARAAIERWRFRPARYQGVAQTVTGVEQTIRFELTR